ncbi:FRG domain-containing protein [Aliivibrio wodanis]|uniref:FRG domain-containing protein n=1 Tax=Aliivibrio wodanis TaxID=80852 RepID=UPI00406C2CBF
MSIETIEVKTLSEYIEVVERVSKTFDCHSSDVWYRGISDDSYELVPGIKWRNIDEEVHRDMVDEFLSGSVLYQDISQLTSFETYALMQHYGLPTRLLDWSLSPLTALFFALEQDEERERRVVWVLNPHIFNEVTQGAENMIFSENLEDINVFELDRYLPIPLKSEESELPDEPIALFVRPSNKRIASQQGGFTVHGDISKPIDKYMIDSQTTDQMVKIEINGKNTRKNIQESLFTIGIREDHIYQDLGALSKRIMRVFADKVG